MATPAAIPKPGDTIGGKYRVERLLATGGMGAVFEVSHRLIAKRFALKWLLADTAAADGGAARFVREAQLASRFRHPNVVEIYDIGHDGDSFYMIMELLEGESLLQRLARVARLSADQARAIIVPCMDGVAAAHAAGIIHRDLKPANIFICQACGRHGEQSKVLDFGISKLAGLNDATQSPLTTSGAVIGTPHYMAPEQMRARTLDQRVDVYAFGVMLYEMLSGKRPFEAETYADLVLQVISDKPEPLAKLLGDESAELAAVVECAMARDPELRFATLQQFMAALEAKSLAHSTSRLCVDLLRHEPARVEVAAEPPPCREVITSSAARKPDAQGSTIWLTLGWAAAALALGFIGMLHRDATIALTNATEMLVRAAAASPSSASKASHPTGDSSEALAAPRPLEQIESGRMFATQGSIAGATQPLAPALPANTVATTAALERVARRDSARAKREPTVSSAQLVAAAQHELVDGHLAAAAKLYSQATQRDPWNPSAWSGLGLANEGLGRTADAVRSLREALRLSPEGQAADALRGRLRMLDAAP